MTAFRLECYKARRRLLPLVTLGMVLFEILWTIIGFHRMSAADRAQGYSTCLYQVPILNAIVLPVMISILASRICDMEHKGSTLKTLLTLQRPGSLFDAKSALLALHLLAAVLLQAASFPLLGLIYGFTEAFPLSQLLYFVPSQLLPCFFMGLLVQILSLRSANAFLPLVTGLIGGFLGLMSMFFPPVVMRLVPTSYFGLLSSVRMNWDEATRITEFYYVDFPVWDFLLLAAASAALYFIGRRAFVKREV